MFRQASKSDPVSTQTLSFTVSRRNTRTFEAFAEATDKLMRSFDQWCANKEEAICMAKTGFGPPHIVSLLDLEKSLRDEFSETFEVLLGLLRNVVRRATQPSDSVLGVWTFADLPKRMPPAAITALLLDSLLQKMQDYSSMGDLVTSDALLRIFSDTAEPLWGMVYRWLKDGMSIRDVLTTSETQDLANLNEEFFIEDNELVLLDPDFWSDGFVLKSNTDDIGRASSVPVFLQDAAPHILSAGKAVGLLHALGMPLIEQSPGVKWMDKWRNLGALLQSARMERSTNGGAVLRMSSDDFSRLVYDELLEPCALAKQTLSRVLVEECDLWIHLTAIEELYLMRRGDVMSNFLDVIFTRVRVHSINPRLLLITCLDGELSIVERLPLPQHRLRGRRLACNRVARSITRSHLASRQQRQDQQSNHTRCGGAVHRIRRAISSYLYLGPSIHASLFNYLCVPVAAAPGEECVGEDTSSAVSRIAS